MVISILLGSVSIFQFHRNSIYKNRVENLEQVNEQYLSNITSLSEANKALDKLYRDQILLLENVNNKYIQSIDDLRKFLDDSDRALMEERRKNEELDKCLDVVLPDSFFTGVFEQPDQAGSNNED